VRNILQPRSTLKGATLQATYYDKEKKCILSAPSHATIHISGKDILTNAQVNVASVLITSVVGFYIGGLFFG
jgi:hypothetical protein